MTGADIEPDVINFISALAEPRCFAVATHLGVEIRQLDESRIGGSFRYSEEWARNPQILALAWDRQYLNTKDGLHYTLSKKGRNVVERKANGEPAECYVTVLAEVKKKESTGVLARPLLDSEGWVTLLVDRDGVSVSGEVEPYPGSVGQYPVAQVTMFEASARKYGFLTKL